MRAAGPAAGATHAGFHLGNCFPDTNPARLGAFAGYDPTDPFIAREGSNVSPKSPHLFLGSYRFLKIKGKFMHAL